MKNKEFSDTNNDLINKLLFLQSNLNKLNEIESQFDQLEDTILEKDAFDDHGPTKGITSRGTARIIKNFINSLNNIRRRKFIEKGGLASVFDKSSLIDIESLVSEFYNLAFKTKGDTNDFISAIENSGLEEIYQFNQYMNKMHLNQKEKYLSYMVCVMSNQQRICSLKNILNTEGKWPLSEIEKNLVENHLSELRQADNDIINDPLQSEMSQKLKNFLNACNNIKNGEQTSENYLDVLRFLAPKNLNYSALVNNKSINMCGHSAGIRTLIDKMVASKDLVNPEDSRNFYIDGARPFIEALVDGNRKFTAYTIKESIEKEIETIESKLDSTSLKLHRLRLSLKNFNSKNLNNEERDYYHTNNGKKKPSRVQTIDMINFEYFNISKTPDTIKKFNKELDFDINNTITKYSSICAALAIQPIPFADIFILTPTQILMGKKIAELRGYEIKKDSIELILKEISGIIGMGIIAQQLVIGSYKTFLPFLGAITTIPIIYGLTFGIGKVMDYYITAKVNGQQINKNEIEKIFKYSREIGELEGKLKENEIKTTALNINPPRA